MILDTTFFIDLLRNDPLAIKKATELEKKNIPLAATTVTVFELWRGFSKLKNPEKIERACEMLDQLTIYSLDIQSAKTAGEIAHNLDRLGQVIDPEDSLIAGIAVEKHEEILTRNIRHFNRIPHLLVSDY